MTETNISTARVPQVTVIDPRIPEKAKLRVNCGNSGSCAAVFWRQPVKTGRSMTQSE